MSILRPRLGFLVCTILLSSLGCGAIRISTHPDPAPNLYGYRTYSWMSRAVPSPTQPNLASLDARIRAAVDANLSLKGYVQRPLSAPDFLIGYRTETHFKTTESIEEFYNYRQAGGEQGPQEAFGRGFEEGSLMLELIDAKTRQPIWRASAASVIGEKASGDRISEAVRLMLEKLPPATW